MAKKKESKKVVATVDEAKGLPPDLLSGVVTQLKPGIYENIPPDVYHRQDSLSRGDLVMARWPAKLRYAKDHPEIENTSPAKEFGQMFHTALLEPDLFKIRHVVSPYTDFRTNEAKAWRDEQEKKGRTILSKVQQDTLDKMVGRAREHPQFSEVFRRAGMKRELTVISRDPATGLLLRCRIDILPSGNIIPDIKSTLDASPEGFGRQVWNLEYGMQAAHYLKVYNIANPQDKRTEFMFYAFEKEPPYLSAFYVTPYMVIQYYQRILRARLYVIANCMKTGVWPGYPEREGRRWPEFELPGWAVREIEEATE